MSRIPHWGSQGLFSDTPRMHNFFIIGDFPIQFSIYTSCSLRSWRDFARECLCFGCETVNGSGEAVGGLVKSRVEFHSPLRRSRIPRGLRPRWNVRPLSHPASYAGYTSCRIHHVFRAWGACGTPVHYSCISLKPSICACTTDISCTSIRFPNSSLFEKYRGALGINGQCLRAANLRHVIQHGRNMYYSAVCVPICVEVIVNPYNNNNKILVTTVLLSSLGAFPIVNSRR